MGPAGCKAMGPAFFLLVVACSLTADLKAQPLPVHHDRCKPASRRASLTTAAAAAAAATSY